MEWYYIQLLVFWGRLFYWKHFLDVCSKIVDVILITSSSKSNVETISYSCSVLKLSLLTHKARACGTRCSLPEYPNSLFLLEFDSCCCCWICFFNVIGAPIHGSSRGHHNPIWTPAIPTEVEHKNTLDSACSYFVLSCFVHWLRIFCCILNIVLTDDKRLQKTESKTMQSCGATCIFIVRYLYLMFPLKTGNLGRNSNSTVSLTTINNIFKLKYFLIEFLRD